MSIQIRHCTNCKKELSYTNGYENELFYFCQNRHCILKGVQQIGMEAFDELIVPKEIENEMICEVCGHWTSMHGDDGECYSCEDDMCHADSTN